MEGRPAPAPLAAQIEDGIAQFGALHSAVHRQLLGFIASYDREQHWRDDGASSMAEWLTWRQGIGIDTAREWVSVAEALESRPRISEAFLSGRLAFDQVLPLCELSEPGNEAAWAEDGVGMTASQLRRAARRKRVIEEHTAAQQLSMRYLRFDMKNNTFSGCLPAAEMRAFKKAVDRLAKAQPEDPESGMQEPYQVRCADALVGMAEVSLSNDADPQRASVVLYVEEKALKESRGRAHLEDGEPVSAAVAERLCCDALVRVAVTAEEGDVVGVGRASRNVPWWLALLVRRRDGGCVFPGCGRTFFLHCHHIVPWSRGGRTDLDNLVSVCSYHHRALHEGGFRARGSPESLEFFRPSGEPLRPRAAVVRPGLRDRVMGLLWRPTPRLGFEEA